MYVAARDAIHAVDPAAVVVVGGLAIATSSNGVPVADFVRRMISAQPALSSKLDAVGLHPYAPTASANVAYIRDLRLAMRANGVGDRPIDVNEWGAATPTTSESQRAALYRDTADALATTDCGVGFVGPFTAYTGAQGFGIFVPAAPPATGVDPTSTATTYADRIAFWRGLQPTQPPTTVNPDCA